MKLVPYICYCSVDRSVLSRLLKVFRAPAKAIIILKTVNFLSALEIATALTQTTTARKESVTS